MSRVPRALVRGVSTATFAVMVGLACGPVRPAQVSSAPTNDCPTNPCQNYVQSSDVQCIAGRCTIASSAAPATGDLVVVVSIPDDAFPACAPACSTCVPTSCSSVPGRAVAIAYDTLASSSVSSVSASPSGATGTADASIAEAPAMLPSASLVGGYYAVSPDVVMLVGPTPGGAALGNPGEDTSLPIRATFRLLWPQSDGTLVDAESLGLPIDPVTADAYQNANGLPGPDGSSETDYQTYLPPGTYERTLTPDPPWDQAFAPVTEDANAFATFDRGLLTSFDTTAGNTLPTLDIAREGGTMDGWTAYLRDVTTKRVVSNLAPLSGASTPNVVFAVKRVPLDAAQPDPDALSNDELVVAPPVGSSLPTGVFNLFDMLSPVAYPALPPPATVSGAVTVGNGSPQPAQLVFEALSITGGVDFEFTTWADTSTDAASGATTYDVTLPQGTYRVDVRPPGPLPTAAQSSSYPALQVSTIVVTQDTSLDFVLDSPRVIPGTATIADLRPLSGATVEALPQSCVDGSSSTWCLPRATQSSTLVDGSFELALDPGAYLLRVRPLEGTGLPWVVAAQPLTNAPGEIGAIPPIIVHAPTSVGLTLADAAGNVIPNALVRMFRMLAGAAGAGSSADRAVQAVQVGEAITGPDGRYEMYLDAPSQ